MSETLHLRLRAPYFYPDGEDTGDELENVEALAFGMGKQGLVMGAFALVEQCPGTGRPVNTREADGAAKQVSAESFEPLGVLRPNGGRGVDGEAAISKREEQVQAFVAQEIFTPQQAKYFVSE